MPLPVRKLVKTPHPPGGVLVDEMIVAVRPVFWSLALSTRPLTVPVTDAGLLGDPGPLKEKLKVSAAALPASSPPSNKETAHVASDIDRKHDKVKELFFTKLAQYLRIL